MTVDRKAAVISAVKHEETPTANAASILEESTALGEEFAQSVHRGDHP